MIEIRPLHQEEIETAQKLVPANNVEPDWPNVWAILDEREMVGILGMESRLVVEPLYMKPGNYSQALMTMSWVDGFLRSIAAQQGKTGYEFFVGDENPRFQELIAKRLPVKAGREKKGLFYFRHFEA